MTLEMSALAGVLRGGFTNSPPVIGKLTFYSQARHSTTGAGTVIAPAAAQHLSVGADRQTLSPGDFAKVMDLLKFRPIQFCLFLKVLVGAEEMQRMMVQAIKAARQA